MRLIDADAFKEWVDKYYDCTNLGAIVMSWIDEQPTIEAEPVKRGRWVSVKGYEGILYKCSACDGRWSHTTIRTPYCGECGAKMERME